MSWQHCTKMSPLSSQLLFIELSTKQGESCSENGDGVGRVLPKFLPQLRQLAWIHRISTDLYLKQESMQIWNIQLRFVFLRSLEGIYSNCIHRTRINGCNLQCCSIAPRPSAWMSGIGWIRKSGGSPLPRSPQERDPKMVTQFPDPGGETLRSSLEKGGARYKGG